MGKFSDVFNIFKNDPVGGTKLRFELAARIAICTAISLIFGIGYWWKSPLKYMASILTVVIAFLTPPYLGSSIMVLGVVGTGLTISLAVITGAMLVGSNYWEGSPDGEMRYDSVMAVYLTLLVFWVVVIPPMKTTNLQIGLIVVMVVVAMPVYGWQALEDMFGAGVVFGYECASQNGVRIGCGNTLRGFCAKEYDISFVDDGDGNQKEYDGLITTIPIILCNPTNRERFADALDAGQSLCLPVDQIVGADNLQGVVEITRDFYPSLDEEAYDAADLFVNEEMCVGFDPNDDNIMWAMVKPGSWLVDFLWRYIDYRMGPFTSICYAFLIACAAVFLMSFLPPARFATDRLRTLIRDQMLRLRNERLPAALPAGVNAHEDLLAGVDIVTSVPQDPLPHDCTIGPSAGRKRLFGNDEPIFSTMNTIGALTVVEINFLDPGPFVALWPSYRKIIPMMKTFSDQMVMTAFLADLSSDVHTPDTMQESLLQTVDRLMFEMAFCMSLRPSAGGSAVFNTELMCLKLEEKCDAVKDAAASWTVVTDAGDSAEKRILVEGHRLAALQMAGSACAIGDGIMAMLKNHSTPSFWGLCLSLIGLALPVFAIFLEILKFWWRVLTCAWNSKWKGDWSWWKDPRFVNLIQFFIGLFAVVFAFGFMTDFRRLGVVMVNPVYAVPSGRLGTWAAVPLAVMLLHSWHGTVFRAPIRLLGISLGAVIGVPALEMVRWARLNGVLTMSSNIEIDPLTNAPVTTTDSNIFFWGNFSCIAYLTVVVFICVICSVDTTGRLAMYGTFHNQYGYGPFMVAYFAVLVATEGVDLTLNLNQGVEQGNQPAPYGVWDYVATRILGQAFGVVVVVFVATILPIRAGAAARKLSSQCLRLLARALLTGIQTWRGDDVEPEAEQEALEDLEWTFHGRNRVSTFIMEMDGLGRLRETVGDHFFTFWSGNKQDLPALRTLHLDMTMFITQLMKGCRAPIGPMPPFLDRLSTAVDIWAVSCAKRIVFIANGQYHKMQGLHSPSDEALDTFEAFRSALPGLIELAEYEVGDTDSEQYDIDEEYAEAKVKKEAPYPYGTEDKREYHHNPMSEYPLAPEESDVGSLYGAYQLAETSLEADQRWQLLIAMLVALERAIFSALPDLPEVLEPENFDAPYAYGYEDPDEDDEEMDEFDRRSNNTASGKPRLADRARKSKSRGSSRSRRSPEKVSVDTMSRLSVDDAERAVSTVSTNSQNPAQRSKSPSVVAMEKHGRAGSAVGGSVIEGQELDTYNYGENYAASSKV